MMEDTNVDKTKASSEETLSCGDVNSFKFLEEKDTSSLENLNNHCGDKSTMEVPSSQETEEPPTLFRPLARVSAFSVYPRQTPSQGPLVQATMPDAGTCKLLEGVYGERMVPHWCGYGCCGIQHGGNCQSSLLGPEFFDFSGPPAFPSYELAAIATDISNVAWLKSGLENSSVTVMGDEAGRIKN